MQFDVYFFLLIIFLQQLFISARGFFPKFKDLVFTGISENGTETAEQFFNSTTLLI